MGMHFLGGVMLATFAIGLFPHRNPWFFTGFVFVGSLAWEVFEYSFGVSGGRNFFFDTVLDLLMDILGAALIFLMVRFTLWRSK